MKIDYLIKKYEDKVHKLDERINELNNKTKFESFKDKLANERIIVLLINSKVEYEYTIVLLEELKELRKNN